MNRTFVSFMLLAVLATPLGAEEIHWQTLPLIGVAELKDGKPADGVVFAVQQVIERFLPDYTHRYSISAPKRLLHDLQAGYPRCTTILLQGHELGRASYFVPFLPALPMQLVVRADAYTSLPLQEGGEVSLEQILNSRLKGAITASRGYPNDLQPLLSKAVVAARLQSINSNSNGANLLSMIQVGRLDYTIELPIVIKRFSDTTPQPEQLIGVPISEDNKLATTGFYCARTEWGKTVARRLDQAIRELASTPEKLMPLYLNAYDSASVERFEPHIRAWLAQRALTPLRL